MTYSEVRKLLCWLSKHKTSRLVYNNLQVEKPWMDRAGRGIAKRCRSHMTSSPSWRPGRGHTIFWSHLHLWRLTTAAHTAATPSGLQTAHRQKHRTKWSKLRQCFLLQWIQNHVAMVTDTQTKLFSLIRLRQQNYLIRFKKRWRNEGDVL